MHNQKSYAFKCWFLAVVAGLLGLSIATVPAQPPPETWQVIVQFKAGKDEAKAKETVEKHGGRVKKHLHWQGRAQGKGPLVVVETAEPVEQAVQKFKKDPNVEFAEPDWIVRHQTAFASEVISPEAIANDTYYSAGYLWGLMDTGANSFGTRASAAWAAGYTGARSVYVGIIDEGVQWQHADLAVNIWNNPFDPADGLDNDGNGYVDDAHGWDFYSGDNSVYDAGGDAHGTHVAGTIAAAGGNSRGVVGVNWQATVISTKFLGAEGGYTSDAIAAIDYYVDLKERHGLNIVALNNSWGGGGYSQALHDAVLRAAKAGMLFVAAAGNGDANGVALNNDTRANYPSNYDTTRGTSTESPAGYNAVIAVAALDRNGALGAFSNYGSRTVHIGAPGVSVLSTVPGGYAHMDGTSMAAPHVTGGVALYASTHSGKSANEIRQALLQSLAPTPALKGKSTTGGRLNLAQVIAPSGGVSGGTPTPAKFEAPAVVDGQFRVRLKGTIGQVYEVQVSPDLTNWTPLGTVTNTTGTAEMADPISTDWPKKFYRAVTK
jgi:subtilisin family serine protease